MKTFKSEVYHGLPMKVYVIDNGGQWTHREWRVLRYLGVDTRIVPNRAPFESIADADALILSGGSPSVAADGERMGNNGEYLDKAEVPVLGICAGMQFMSTHFGGETAPAKVPEYGKVTIAVSEDAGLFERLPREFTVWASHNDEVRRVPSDFRVVARSEVCEVQAIEHKERPLFGLQFHPEVEDTEHGMEIFRNFLNIVEKWR